MERKLTGTFRLAYEKTMEGQGRPWRIELPTGDCLYTGRLEIQVPAQTVWQPGMGRFSGYLECAGVLEYTPERSVVKEPDEHA